MYVRLKDIAEKAGCSVNAVSRALRNAPDIGEETTKKIQQLADEMGYVRNDIHQYTFNRTSKIVGVVISSVKNPYFFVVLSKIIDEFVGTDYCPLVINCKPGVMKDCHLRSLMSKRVGGIISFINMEDDVVEKCAKFKIPLVLVGVKPSLKTVNAFYWEEEECGRLIAEEYVKSARKNPCFTGYSDISFSEKRLFGFFNRLREAGESCTVYDLYDENSPLVFDNFQQGFDKTAQRIIENKNDFIFCMNDEVAALLDKTLLKYGYSGYEIYGVDGISKYMPSYGKLNSVCVDYTKVIKNALKRLYELIATDNDGEYTFDCRVCPLEIVKE